MIANEWEERREGNMEIRRVLLSTVKPYENNPRINDEAVNAVKESIRQCGYCAPIVVDENLVILAGHTRHKALTQLGGHETCEVCVVSGLTEEQKRKYRILDNKTNEIAKWDWALLNKELEGLDFEGFDFGFDIPELAEEAEVVEDEAPEINSDEPAITKTGDLWVLGRHRLLCGDSTDKSAIERLIKGAKINMVYTDPPYGMNAVSKSGVLSKRYSSDIMGDDDNTVAIDSYLLAMQMFGDARHVWWGANYYTECLPGAECWIVWNKNNGASDQTDCELAWTNFRSVVRMFTMASEKKNRVHPTQKPVKLFDEIVKKFEKDERYENILDMFGGSGSTLIACEQTKRNCFVMELDPKYCDVIVKRWENLTGKKAVLSNG